MIKNKGAIMDKKVKIIATIGIFGLISGPLYPCVITIINDSSNKILVRDMHDEARITEFVLPKGKMRRIGNPHKMAHFEVSVKKTKGPLYSLAYECKQNECGINKNPHIKLSDLADSTDTMALFTVINHLDGHGNGNKKPACCGGHK